MCIEAAKAYAFVGKLPLPVHCAIFIFGYKSCAFVKVSGVSAEDRRKDMGPVRKSRADCKLLGPLLFKFFVWLIQVNHQSFAN